MIQVFPPCLVSVKCIQCDFTVLTRACENNCALRVFERFDVSLVRALISTARFQLASFSAVLRVFKYECSCSCHVLRALLRAESS